MPDHDGICRHPSHTKQPACPGTRLKTPSATFSRWNSAGSLQQKAICEGIVHQPVAHLLPMSQQSSQLPSKTSSHLELPAFCLLLRSLVIPTATYHSNHANFNRLAML